MSQLRGKVYLMGAGPGDPGLMTLRGQEVLNKADVVFYDHLIHPDFLKWSPQAVHHYVGKVGYGDHVAQEKILRSLKDAVERYEVVVRLKGGDPFLFGRGGEEAEYLFHQGIDFEIVPGVTSALAVPAYAGIPLTHRELSSSVGMITGHQEGDKIDWNALAKLETLVILMGVKNLGENFDNLLKAGKEPQTPAALITWGTYPRQQTLVGTLKDLPEKVRREGMEAPAIIVVGQVVGLRDQLQWFERRPLLGHRVLVTRSRSQLSTLKDRLWSWGAWVLEMPTLELLPPEDWNPCDRALDRIQDFEWILFSSTNGVNFFFDHLKERKQDIRSLVQAKLVAVGPATARSLQSLGLRVERVPKEYTTDALAASLQDEEIAEKKILFPRAVEAREEILQNLISRGAQIDVVPVYRAVLPKYNADYLENLFGEYPPELLTFASSSTVQNFYEILKASPWWQTIKKIPALVIGPVTWERAEKLGLNVIGMPTQYTIPEMAQSVLDYFKGI
jgi:uroporphyrinogen III methyltransferase/synthase